MVVVIPKDYETLKIRDIIISEALMGDLWIKTLPDHVNDCRHNFVQYRQNNIVKRYVPEIYTFPTSESSSTILDTLDIRGLRRYDRELNRGALTQITSSIISEAEDTAPNILSDLADSLYSGSRDWSKAILFYHSDGANSVMLRIWAETLHKDAMDHDFITWYMRPLLGNLSGMTKIYIKMYLERLILSTFSYENWSTLKEGGRKTIYYLMIGGNARYEDPCPDARDFNEYSRFLVLALLSGLKWFSFGDHIKKEIIVGVPNPAEVDETYVFGRGPYFGLIIKDTHKFASTLTARELVNKISARIESRISSFKLSDNITDKRVLIFCDVCKLNSEVPRTLYKRFGLDVAMMFGLMPPLYEKRFTNGQYLVIYLFKLEDTEEFIRKALTELCKETKIKKNDLQNIFSKMRNSPFFSGVSEEYTDFENHLDDVESIISNLKVP